MLTLRNLLLSLFNFDGTLLLADNFMPQYFLLDRTRRRNNFLPLSDSLLNTRSSN